MLNLHRGFAPAKKNVDTSTVGENPSTSKVHAEPAGINEDKLREKEERRLKKLERKARKIEKKERKEEKKKRFNEQQQAATLKLRKLEAAMEDNVSCVRTKSMKKKM